MTDLMHLVKFHGLKLAPFVNFAILYLLFAPSIENVVVTTILKCLPIFCLMFYVVLKGFAFTKDYKYSQLILLGLIFSSLGDAFLNQENMFPHGMAGFAIAQIFYISAFAWKPLKWPIGLAYYVFAAIIVGFTLSKIDELAIAIGLPIYGLLLTTMSWRAIAQAIGKPSAVNNLCAIGSVLFVISDGTICLNMFIIEVKYSFYIIMITYYLAQFAIALSTAVEAKATKKKSSPKRSKQSIQSRISNSENVRRRGKSRD